MARFISCCCLVIVLISSIQHVYAQGEAAAEFLLIAPGARAGGMGEANVAIGNDATTVHWNPAGLPRLEKDHEFTLMRAEWLPQFNLGDVFYYYGAYTHRLEDLGSFGLGITYLTLGEQIRTDETGIEIGRFDSYNLAVSLAYGTDLSEKLSVGATVKYIYLKLADAGTGAEKGSGSAYSIGVDIGVLYDTKLFFPVTLGASLANMGPSVSFIDVKQSDPIPTYIKWGYAVKLLDRQYNQLSWTTDFTKLLVVRKDDDIGSHDAWYKAIFTSWTDKNQGTIKRISVATGIEYWYSGVIALRTGYFYEDIGKRRFITFGAGLRYAIYGIDIGYISADKEGSPLADTIRISLSIKY